jgi:hypothetical protein
MRARPHALSPSVIVPCWRATACCEAARVNIRTVSRQEDEWGSCPKRLDHPLQNIELRAFYIDLHDLRQRKLI